MKVTELSFCFGLNFFQQHFEQMIYTIIIELTGNSANNGKLVIFSRKQLVISFILLSYVIQRIQCTGFVKLIDTNKISIIQHIDLLQLRSSTILRRHHVHTDITMIQNACITLPNTGALKYYKIETGLLTYIDCFIYST